MGAPAVPDVRPVARKRHWTIPNMPTLKLSGIPPRTALSSQVTFATNLIKWSGGSVPKPASHRQLAAMNGKPPSTT